MNFAKELELRAEHASNALRRFISSQSFNKNYLLEAMYYGALLGGKRLRPFLVYATGNMFGVSDATLDVAAAAIECIHAYSLIHDDLPAMDNNDLRRGKPTCHIQFGEANAILAGDALQAMAFSILSSAPMAEVADLNRLAMISELAIASGVSGMCGGQALDIESRDSHVTIEQLEHINRHKTGALIRAAVRLGALSAGDRGRNLIPLLDRYAESIGLAFQIQDDILDMTGDTVTLGKHRDADQYIGKNTYPALLGLKQAKSKALNLIHEARQTLIMIAVQSLDISALEALANYIIQRNK